MSCEPPGACQTEVEPKAGAGSNTYMRRNALTMLVVAMLTGASACDRSAGDATRVREATAPDPTSSPTPNGDDVTRVAEPAQRLHRYPKRCPGPPRLHPISTGRLDR